MASTKGSTRRQALVVLGMHRSGTSALTRVLNLLGADLPSRLMPPLPGINEKGFWESEELVEINDEVLAAIGSSWDDLAEIPSSWYGSALARYYEGWAVDFLGRELGHSSLFVLKDPRMCRLVPFWLAAFRSFGADPRYVLILRHPLEAAASLRKRGDVSTPKALLLWLRYLLDAERDTRESRRAFICFDTLLHDWRAAAGKLANALGVTWPRGLEAAAAEVGDFLSDRHRHHRATLAQLAARAGVPCWIPRAYALALEAEETGHDGALASGLDAIRADLAAALESLGPALSEAEEGTRSLKGVVADRERELAEQEKTVERLRGRLEEEKLAGEDRGARLAEQQAATLRLGKDLDRAQAALAAVLETRSWRWTGPMRWLHRSLREVLRRQDAAMPPADVEHELATGTAAGHEPCPLFDAGFYLRQNPDVAAAGTDPFVHFLEQGAVQLRDPHPLFDTAFYYDQMPELRDTGVNPLLHYLAHGHLLADACDPNVHFDSRYYLKANPDVRRTGLNPLIHFLSSGAMEARKIHHRFDGAKLAARLASGVELTCELLSACTLDFRNEEELYEHLTAEIRLLKDIRDHDFEPRPPPLIELAAEEEAVAVLRELRLPPAAADPVVSIIIPVYNQMGRTVECLVSLSRHTDLRRHEILIVDDASEDFRPDLFTAATSLRYLRNETNVGFLKSCLRGAEAAASREYLLFLNNDTQVTPSWLEALLETLSRGDDVAVAGPKLVFPDGRLQEAGAAVASDGSSRLIGLSSDPESARYNYSREVDYCSGACLLVKRSAWEAVGGFDLRYAPAYCEDVDLCFRLRRAGFKVVYNPRSVVIHHLSQTSNELSGSYKAAKVARNRRILMETWAEEVERLNDVRLIAFPDRGLDVRAMAQQAELAKNHGIHGICYDADVDVDVPADLCFCLCFSADALARASVAMEPLGGSGYIRIGARPLILVRCSSSAAETKELLEEWRRCCRRQGIGEVYLALLEHEHSFAPDRYGCDAVVEVPELGLSPGRDGMHDFERAMLDIASRDLPGHTVLRGVAPGVSPTAFQAWLASAMADVRAQSSRDERFVFIHAWNDPTCGAALDGASGRHVFRGDVAKRARGTRIVS